jgi:hypothetical protein
LAAVIAREALGGQPLAKGRAAAKDAARASLTPTVDELRESVLGLLDRMLPTETLLLADQVPATFAPETAAGAAFTTSA